MVNQVISQLERSSSWPGKFVVLAIAVLAFNLHASGAPERALATNVGVLVVGAALGLGMLAIVVARLIGRNIGLIHSDRSAIVALLMMIAVKVAIARIFLPV